MKIWFIVVCFLISSASRGEVVERLVTIVNDEIITSSDIKAYRENLAKGGFVDDLVIPDEQTKQDLLKNEDKLLQKMIEERLLDSEVRRQNLNVPIERVEQEIRNTASKNNLSRDEFKLALKQRGVPFSVYQSFIKTILERQSLIEKTISSKIRISDDDVMSKLSAGKREQGLFEYSLSQILILPAKDKQDVSIRANLVFKKLKDGESFEDLASQFSDDPNYTSGGHLGTFKSGEMAKEFEKAVSGLAVGEFSAPFSTKVGTHILKLTKKQIIPDPQIEKEKDQIRAEIYEKAFKKQFYSWLEQLRNESFIRINKS